MEVVRISDNQRRGKADVLQEMDAKFVESGRIHRALLSSILECDRTGTWRGRGARDHAEFLAGRYGISKWKARRRIGAAYALEHLPLTSHALITGTLSLDKSSSSPASQRRRPRRSSSPGPGE